MLLLGVGVALNSLSRCFVIATEFYRASQADITRILIKRLDVPEYFGIIWKIFLPYVIVAVRL